MNCRRGDIVLVPFPNTASGGVKKRPAIVVNGESVSQFLVVQGSDFKSDIGSIIVACITTSTAAGPGAGRIEVDPITRIGKNTGLRHKSRILLDNLATIPVKAVVGILGRYSYRKPLDEALRTVLDLGDEEAKRTS